MTLNTSPSIAFIGAGNMANSLIKGMLNHGHDAQKIYACDPNAEQLERLKGSLGDAPIHTDTNNVRAAHADILVLAVKPQVMQSVCAHLAPLLSTDTLVISIAAGIPVASLRSWLGNVAIVRCMPNTPSLIGEGATGLFADAGVNSTQKAQAEQILSGVGLCQWVTEERLIDAVTAVSGSGPAYFFLFMESMVEAGVAMGLTPDVAAQLAIQTCVGAGKLAQQSDVGLTELRQRVTSPQGTTEQAVLSFQSDNIHQIVNNAMQRCAERATEMAKELG